MATRADVEKLRRVADLLAQARDALATETGRVRELPPVLRQWWERLDREAAEAAAGYARALAEWTKGAALVRDAERRARRLTEMGRRTLAVTGPTEGHLRCPGCGSTRLREHGEAHGEMHYRCRDCGGSLSVAL